MKRPIDGNRLLHILGVAEYMYTKATDYNLDPDEMYLIGILHDIGFINDYGLIIGLERKGFSNPGALLLRLRILCS